MAEQANTTNPEPLDDDWIRTVSQQITRVLWDALPKDKPPTWAEVQARNETTEGATRG